MAKIAPPANPRGVLPATNYVASTLAGCDRPTTIPPQQQPLVSPNTFIHGVNCHLAGHLRGFTTWFHTETKYLAFLILAWSATLLSAFSLDAKAEWLPLRQHLEV
jgi:hypothetical protein